MTKESIVEKVKELLFVKSRNLSREEYRDLLDEIGSDIDSSLEALNEEDKLNEFLYD